LTPRKANTNKTEPKRAAKSYQSSEWTLLVLVQVMKTGERDY
jgi:hypothetical protein